MSSRRHKRGGRICGGRPEFGRLFVLSNDPSLAIPFVWSKRNDPFTVGAVALLLLAIAFVASFVPVLNAALVDPMTALRSD